MEYKYEYEWKKGDKLRVIDSGNKSVIHNGEIVTAINDVFTNDGYMSGAKITNMNGEQSYGFFANRFRKVSSSAKTKVIPEELYVILIDSCKNYVSLKRNYKDAVERAKTESSAVTVYKLVEVAKVSTTRVIKKVSPKRAPRKKVTKKTTKK